MPKTRVTALFVQVLHSSLLVSIAVTPIVVQAGLQVSNAGNLGLGIRFKVFLLCWSWVEK